MGWAWRPDSPGWAGTTEVFNNSVDNFPITHLLSTGPAGGRKLFPIGLNIVRTFQTMFEGTKFLDFKTKKWLVHTFGRPLLLQRIRNIEIVELQEKKKAPPDGLRGRCLRGFRKR
jgi:hypothetical protein